MKLSFGKARRAHISTQLLSDYLDNQTSREQRVRIEEHLHSCADCRAELMSLRQTVAVLRALPRVTVPRAFTLSEAQVGARRPDATMPWYIGAARALGAVAAVVVVAALAVFVTSRFDHRPATSVAWAPLPPAGSNAAHASAARPMAPAMPSNTGQPRITSSGAFGTAEGAVPHAALPAPAAALLPSSSKPTVSGAPVPFPSVVPGAPAVMSAALAQAASAATVTPLPAPEAALALPATGPGSLGATFMSPMSLAAVAPLSGTASLMSPTPASSGPAPSSTAGGGATAPSPAPALAAVSPPPTATLGVSLSLLPSAPLSVVLPAGAGIAFSDHQSLSVVDAAGSRLLLHAAGADLPSISQDRVWIAYREQRAGNAEIWAIRWNGSDAHLLASEAAFPSRDGSGANAVRVNAARWIPAGHDLALSVTEAKGNAVELWAVSADVGDLHFVLNLGGEAGSPAQPDATGQRGACLWDGTPAGGPWTSFSYAPDGQAIALLARCVPGQAAGHLSLFRADGANERVAFQFTANSQGYGYGGQLAWSPGGNSLWAAIPDPNADFRGTGGLSLYRVASSGAAQLAGHISALDTCWSPGADAMIYNAAAPGGGSQTLYLANADGSDPQAYASIISGHFDNWSPDGKQFLFDSAGQVYTGAQGQPQRLIGAEGAISSPGWLGPGQLVYLADQGNTWALVSSGADGKTASFGPPLPKNVVIDMTHQ